MGRTATSVLMVILLTLVFLTGCIDASPDMETVKWQPQASTNTTATAHDENVESNLSKASTGIDQLVSTSESNTSFSASIIKLTYQVTEQDSKRPTSEKATPPSAAIAYTPGGSTGSASLDAVADSILSHLINDDMNDSEIIAAVYKWTKQQITYSSPASSNFLSGAEAGLTYRRGNCYTRAFTQVALLQRAGIEASYKFEYEGRHCWALVGEYVLDTGFNKFMVKESTLQDYVSTGMYLYRTTASPPPPASNTESRTIYLDYKTIPFDTYYQLNPDHLSLYPEHVISVAGINGETRDQWTYRYVDGARVASKDLMVEDDQVLTYKVDEIVLVGQVCRETVVIPAPAGETIVYTTKAELDGQRVPGSGVDGVARRQKKVTAIDPNTGLATAFGPSVETVERVAIPFSVYRYLAPNQQAQWSGTQATP